jgi:Ca2+-binding RTX toxin-like protein
VKIGGAGADNLTLGANASHDVGDAAGTLTIDDQAGTGNLTVTSQAGMAANLVIIAGSGTTDTLTGGSGNDTFELAAAHFHNASQSITGGAGSDTIWITDTAAITISDGDFNNVHSVETLKLGGSGANSVTLGTAASADVGGAGHTLTVDDQTGTGPLTLDGSQLTANLVVDLASANFNASDHITGGAGSDTIALVDQTGIVVADAAFTNVTGIETLKIGGAADDAVTLGAHASADVGGVGHTFMLDDSAGLGNLSLDGSAMTANMTVLAGKGNDVVTGGAGNDTFFAGLGNDIFTGGAGNNTYAFGSLTFGTEQITDFNDTTRSDQVQVSAAAFGGGLAPGQDVTPVYESSASNAFTSSTDRFHFDTANHGLYYSADGTTAHEILLATITNSGIVHPGSIHVVT